MKLIWFKQEKIKLKHKVNYQRHKLNTHKTKKALQAIMISFLNEPPINWDSKTI